MDKEDVVHIYNGILLSHKKEQNTHSSQAHILEERLHITPQNKS